jgi:NADPH2:quinone reductase
MHAIRIHSTGGPDALVRDEVPRPEPRPDEALVRLEAVGLNFIDVYQRSGVYPVPLPATLGQEGAGTVEAVGDAVRGLRPGDRVAYTGVLGAYAEYAAVPAARLVRLPDGVTARQAAAAMLQGLTAHYLATSTYPLEPGRLVPRARGGRRRGAAARADGAAARRARDRHHEQRREGGARAGRRRGGGGALHRAGLRRGDAAHHRRGRVQVVYDSVGRTTFERGLGAIAPRGMMVLFGASSGPVAPFDPQLLNRAGSLFLTRPTLGDYTATREELEARCEELFGWITSGRRSRSAPSTHSRSRRRRARTPSSRRGAPRGRCCSSRERRGGAR